MNKYSISERSVPREDACKDISLLNIVFSEDKPNC